MTIIRKKKSYRKKKKNYNTEIFHAFEIFYYFILREIFEH